MSVLQLDEFKTRQRATWEGGDYSACSPYIAEVGELVVSRVGITAGMRVLDVACGTGNSRSNCPGDGACVPPRRRYCHRDVDARGRVWRPLDSGGSVHATASRVRLSAAAVGS
jgi:hypothetical protein